MQRQDYLQPFSWEEIDAPVSIILVGPKGPVYPKLSQALSFVRDGCQERSEWSRWVRSFVWVLNTTYRDHPDFAALMLSGVDGFREAIPLFLKVKELEVTLSPIRGGMGRSWVNLPSDLYRYVDDALMAVGMVSAALTKSVYGGQDPFKIDSVYQSELRSRRSVYRGKIRADVFRLFRMGKNLEIGPRFEDPRIAELWLAEAVRFGAPEVFQRLVRTSKGTGARSSSLLPLNLADLLIFPKKWGEITAPAKRSGKRRVLALTTDPEDFADFEEWINEELLRFTGASLESYRLAASKAKGDPKEWKALVKVFKKIPLFTEDGVNPIKYERLARIFREVAKQGKLYFLSDRGGGRLKTVTFHHLRHEYVFDRLEDIELLPEHEREAESRALVSYMGWAPGDAMLTWYSNHYDRLFGVEAARKASRRIRDRQANGQRPTQPVAFVDDPNTRGLL